MTYTELICVTERLWNSVYTESSVSEVTVTAVEPVLRPYTNALSSTTVESSL